MALRDNGNIMLSNVDQILKEFGERVTKLARINIGRTTTEKNWKGKNVRRRIDFSGKLRNSLDYGLDVTKNAFGFYIEMEDYGIDVDQGKKAGGMKPSIPKLINWIEKKPAKLRDSKGQFIEMTLKRKKSFAEHIAYIHARYGTQPTNFLSDPFEQEFKLLPEKITEAFSLDIDTFLETSLSELNKPNK